MSNLQNRVVKVSWALLVVPNIFNEFFRLFIELIDVTDYHQVDETTADNMFCLREYTF